MRGAGRPAGGLGGLPDIARRSFERRDATSASGWPRTWRPPQDPKVPGQEGAASILGDETTHLSIDGDGKIVVITRQQPHGQSHETTLAQVVSDELGVRFEDVRVVFGDTDVTPFALVGTGGSRAATMANGAVLHASRELREKVLSIAAELLEANPADLEIDRGVISVPGNTAGHTFARRSGPTGGRGSRTGCRKGPTRS